MKRMKRVTDVTDMSGFSESLQNSPEQKEKAGSDPRLPIFLWRSVNVGRTLRSVNTPASIYTPKPDVATSLARCRLTGAAWGKSESGIEYPGNGQVVESSCIQRDVPVQVSWRSLSFALDRV